MGAKIALLLMEAGVKALVQRALREKPASIYRSDLGRSIEQFFGVQERLCVYIIAQQMNWCLIKLSK